MKVNIGGKYFHTSGEKCCSKCQRSLENEHVYSYASFTIKIDKDDRREGESHYVHICQNCYLASVEPQLQNHVLDSYYAEAAVAYSDGEDDTISDILQKEERRYHPSFINRLINQFKKVKASS